MVYKNGVYNCFDKYMKTYEYKSLRSFAYNQVAYILTILNIPWKSLGRMVPNFTYGFQGRIEQNYVQIVHSSDQHHDGCHAHIL